MTNPAPAISICIPTYNASAWVAQCLGSIEAYPPGRPYEIVVVDDRSSDDTVATVRSRFPQTRIRVNRVNVGFSTSINAALRAAGGRFLLVLNNDTVVHPGALDTLVTFLDANPAVGIVGPKVLSRDGSIQNQCRRRIPTPTGALLYFTGLSRRFANDPRFARYLLTAADENATIEVDAVSGSCLLLRREVLETSGFFDEEFFLYGEDMDFCYRAKLAGWRVVYHPAATITHFGGEGGTAAKRLKATVEFHRAMWLFYRKHRAPRVAFPERALVFSGIALKGALAVAVNALRRTGTPGTAKP